MVENLLLDRDGVINKLISSNSEKISPQSLKEFEYIEGSKESIKKAKANGLSVYVFSNQPDVSKDWRSLDEDSLEQINQELREIGVDMVFNCTHGPIVEDGQKRYRNNKAQIVTCDCRKPQPGLIEMCCKNTSIDPSETIIVGDNESDIEAARRFEENNNNSFESKIKLGREKQIGDGVHQKLKDFVEDEVL